MPTAILSGIGLADRKTLATYIAMLSAADSLSVFKGAVKGLGAKINILEDTSVAELQAAVETVAVSDATDDELRHRLWYELVGALEVQSPTPFSTRSARSSASAIAVRASERLSPSLRKAKRERSDAEAKGEKSAQVDLTEKLGQDISGFIARAKDMLKTEAPLPFPRIVEEEILAMMSDTALMEKIEKEVALTDPTFSENIRQAHLAAQAALAAGGSWALFATIVGQLGFAPYIVAAQASAWVPFVGGSTLVSLLAVLINPFTLIAGIGAIAWVGIGKTGQIVKTAIASRISVLLALSGSTDLEDGQARFLNAMRRLTHEPNLKMLHLPQGERQAFRSHAAFIEERLQGHQGSYAGTPPTPWDEHRSRSDTGIDVTEAALAVSLTAGEQYWHAVAIDPNVIAAADFSRLADLGDPFNFAAEAQSFALKAAGYSLRGYTAEQLVLDKLIADGHAVSLAPQSNTPGLDLILDGGPVQIKCGTSLSILKDHFEKYPDIPVIANVELVEKARAFRDREAPGQDEHWADLVTTLPGFSIQEIEVSVSEALGHAAAIADAGVLELALELGVLRGGVEVIRGRVPLSDLPVWLAMNAGARGTLVFIGGKVGWLAGLVVVGPAGALIFGPAVAGAALMGAGSVQTRIEKLLMQDWHNELTNLAEELHRQTRRSLRRRVQELSRRVEGVKLQSAQNQSDFGSWIASRAEDNLISAIEDLEMLGDAPASEREVLVLTAQSAILAPSAAEVSRARLDIERHFLTRPGLQIALIDNAKGVFANIKGVFQRNN